MGDIIALEDWNDDVKSQPLHLRLMPKRANQVYTDFTGHYGEIGEGFSRQYEHVIQIESPDNVQLHVAKREDNDVFVGFVFDVHKIPGIGVDILLTPNEANLLASKITTGDGWHKYPDVKPTVEDEPIHVWVQSDNGKKWLDVATWSNGEWLDYAEREHPRWCDCITHWHELPEPPKE